MTTVQTETPKNDNSGDIPLCVPGFGLPIDSWVSDETYVNRFRHGANDFLAERMTVREVSMLSLMNALTEKPAWNHKILDDEIVAKWRLEAYNNPLMSEKAFDWCITELKDKAKSYEDSKYVKTLDSASVCIKSDTLISPDIQKELKVAVKGLLSNPDKDWHPKSNNQVLNLVHPSMFPLVFGRTQVLRTGTVGLHNCFDSTGKGEIAAAGQVIEEVRPMPDVPWTPRLDHQNFWSTRYQWLPCELRFQDEDGDKVKIVSCINNLHPIRYEQVYKVIEKLIAASIQPWNEIIFRGEHGRSPVRIRTHGVKFDPPGLPEWSSEVRYGTKRTEEIAGKIRGYLALPNNPDYVIESDEEDIDHWESEEDNEWSLHSLLDTKYKRIRRPLHPEPGVAYSYEEWKQGEIANAVVKTSGQYLHGHQHPVHDVKIEKEFRRKGLQIIVKLSSIELTPEKPEYAGGSWHLEGMLNEHIVATSIYYYDVENVTESRIRFRQEAVLDEVELLYEQDDHNPLAMIFGTESMRDEKAVQEIGSIVTPDGRFLAFPNTLQHRVEPFRLADPTRSGHRRFLVLWLVDPNIRIASTANVPPQQHDWWAEATSRTSGFKLPQEVMNMILDNNKNWPMGTEEAKALRLELMDERTVFTNQVESGFEEYNLCEH